MGKRKGNSTTGKRSSSQPKKKRRPKVSISKPSLPADEEEKEQYSFHSMLRNNNNFASLAPIPEKQAVPITIAQKAAIEEDNVPPHPSPPPSELDDDEEVGDTNTTVALPTKKGASTPIEDAGSILGTWRGYSARNAVEIVRGEMDGTEVAIYRIRDSGVALGGSGWMRVLQGSACILGATLCASSPSFFITSAPLAPYAVTVHPAPSNNNRDVNENNNNSNDWLHRICDDNITSISLDLECGANECIVVFAKTNEQYTDVDLPQSADFYIPRSGLPTCPQGKEIIPGLTILSSNAKIPCLKVWPNWGEVAASISSFSTQSNDSNNNICVLVCGASGTGKSVAVRCILNHLLSCGSAEVVLVDTDVGQPEMNLPGLVAAHSVKSTRPGAACALNRGVPIAARFVGNVSPRDDPELYTCCMKQVVAAGMNYATEKGCPLVLNSDGWITETGADLLRIVLQDARPTHVVAMAFLDSKGQKKVDGAAVINEARAAVAPDRSHELVSPLSGRTTFYSGPLLRDLSIATYFSRVLNTGAVYELALDSYFLTSPAIETIGEPVSLTSTNAFAALNACIVALSTSDEVGGTVLGFGLVRGVDAETGIAYICTPICDMDILDRCERLIISKGIQVPSSLFLALADRAPASIKAPYVEVNVVTTGGQIKSRPNIVRKSLTAA